MGCLQRPPNDPPVISVTPWLSHQVRQHDDVDTDRRQRLDERGLVTAPRQVAVESDGAGYDNDDFRTPLVAAR